MTEFWSKTESILREMEAGEEFDLFAIGYVIPQVALAEEGWDGEMEPKAALLHYIAHSMDEDQINSDDRALIEQVLDHAL